MAEQSDLAQDMPTPRAGHTRQISRSNSQDGTLCYQYSVRDYTMYQYGISHQSQTTLCQHEKVISEYIHKKSRPNNRRWSRAQTQHHRGGWAASTSDTVV